MDYLSYLVKKTATPEKFYIRSFSGVKYWGLNIPFHSQGGSSLSHYSFSELEKIKGEIVSSASKQGYTQTSSEFELYLIDSNSGSASIFFGVKL